LWRFGYAFKAEVAIDYVKHHKLKLPLNNEPLDEAPTWEEVDSRRKYKSTGGGMFAAALCLTARDLSKKSGVQLDTAQTLAFSRNFVVYLWTNYNYDERFRQCPDYDFALNTLDEALKPFSGVTVKPLWYIDLEND
ncbi:uncharacterized protein BXZ73DRAFT_6517, partial [Epithele typhae]|uniref:uncharacterized protein n=1 Tax=Epithele typhae TaxID=378194 RepID=UPI002008606C